ncbi:YebC/PmpR family DNA-binding transcriptional regulator [Simiduia aestuariiviva]|uniref:Probable transcriptional regulatory protein FHS30_002576 n=1 Tax=Simiduia aestuariiviva TaxID=1510459 RepID=A0A839UV64_9GAMM|nr:YebC/PmpR family DNA-binding transcriptional regulator [Simiduia aestuariiviva]MBB3169368.1 YebC/PmpR family DNA-binding regulatory protein [Simiduia aestuariiviva]
MGAQWKAKHRAAAADAKGKLFTRLTKEIMIAARNGADPDMNPRLRLAIDAAKKQSMPRDTLERAVKKGSGQLDGAVTYEKVVYEGFAPHQVPVIVECMTDNVNRTISNIRVLFRKGQLGSSGSVSWDFDHVGLIEAVASGADSDIELAAIEAGAQDFEQGDDGEALFITDMTDLDAVSKALPEFGFAVESAKIGYRPKNPMRLEGDALAEVEAFLAAIDDDDDVHELYVGLA